MGNKKQPYMFCKAVVRRKGPLSPALPKAPQELLVPAGLYGGHVRVAVSASAGVPWGGSPPLRPRPLLRLPVSAAGGGRLCSFSSPSGEILRAFRIIAIKKQPYMFCKAVVRRKGLEPPTF